MLIMFILPSSPPPYIHRDAPYFHLGFDEVNANCWNSDPTVAAYMKQKGLDINGLIEEFLVRERTALNHSGRAAIYWDEVVSTGLHKSLQPKDVVQFWHKGNSGLLETFLTDTPATNTAILSAYTSYYLDCGLGNEFGDASWCDPMKSWRTMYFNDPLAGVDATLSEGRILGGEAALWTEVAGPGSLDAKLWPRAAGYVNTYGTPTSPTLYNLYNSYNLYEYSTTL
jgi:hexosaminidase